MQPIGLDGVAFDTLTLERCGTAPSPDEIVVHAQDVPPGNIVGADWSLSADATAAGGFTLKEVDRGRAKLAAPAAQPPSYVDVPFSAAAGVAYHFWFRMKALNNATASDSVYVQFSGATNASQSADLSRGIHGCRVGDSRERFGRGAGRMGMDRQLVRIACGAGVLRDAGTADAPDPDPRGRRVNRSNRDQRRPVPDDAAGGGQE